MRRGALEAEIRKGDLRTLFSAKTGIPFAEKRLVLIAEPEFSEKNGNATRGVSI